MEKKHTDTICYEPVAIDEHVKLPVMYFTGLSKTKYLVIPEEYFNVEQHVLLEGAILIPMKNDFIADSDA